MKHKNVFVKVITAVLFLLWAVEGISAQAGVEIVGSTQERPNAPAAAISPVLQYQGRLTDPLTGASVPDGFYTMTFRLYNVSSGGVELWTETQDVQVQEGLLSVSLGKTTLLNKSLFNGQELWLGIKVGADPEAVPRQPINPVAYAVSLVPGATIGGDLTISGNLVGGSHNHSGGDITSGSVADARIAATIARDSEIFPLVLSNDGAASTLDADLLDGQHGSFYQNATNLNTGTVGTGLFSAIADLTAEGYLANAAGDLAQNNGILQTNLNADLLDSQSGSYYQNASNINAGTLNNARYSAFSDLSAEGYLGNGSGDLVQWNDSWSGSGIGLQLNSSSSYGIYGRSSTTGSSARGVYGYASSSSGTNYGVYGLSNSTSGYGVYGTSPEIGVYGRATGSSGTTYGVYGECNASSSSGCWAIHGTASSGRDAGVFFGPVTVFGDFSVTNSKNFKIDHPLDPANKYLYHHAVESPEVRNIYEGTAIFDADGSAVVELPDYFAALNTGEYHYQLTPIGGSMPNLYISREIKGNSFAISGGTPGLKVSWQVSAVRNDPYIQDHPPVLEELKPEGERGTYIYPEGYGQPLEAGYLYNAKNEINK